VIFTSFGRLKEMLSKGDAIDHFCAKIAAKIAAKIVTFSPFNFISALGMGLTCAFND
jgi:hypothetical protein